MAPARDVPDAVMLIAVMWVLLRVGRGSHPPLGRERRIRISLPKLSSMFYAVKRISDADPSNATRGRALPASARFRIRFRYEHPTTGLRHSKTDAPHGGRQEREHEPRRPAREKPQTRRRKSLSDKQLAILEVIQRSIARHGYPPSMREIGDAVGLKSLSSVTHQLNQLELSGYLRRDAGKTRAMEVLIDLPGTRHREPRRHRPRRRRRGDGAARRPHRRRRARSRPSSRSRRSSRSPVSSSARATCSC